MYMIINNIIFEPKEKRFKLRQSDSDSEEGIKSASNDIKRRKKISESVDPLQWWKLNEY